MFFFFPSKLQEGMALKGAKEMENETKYKRKMWAKMKGSLAKIPKQANEL